MRDCFYYNIDKRIDTRDLRKLSKKVYLILRKTEKTGKNRQKIRSTSGRREKTAGKQKLHLWRPWVSIEALAAMK